MQTSEPVSGTTSEGTESAGRQATSGAANRPDGLIVLDKVISEMRCPDCAADVERTDDAILCTGCKKRFPIRDGIPLLATYGSSETWTDDAPESTSVDYQGEYDQLAEATKYNASYRNKAEKRWTTKDEFKLINKLLSGQRQCETLLNIPCGGGRLSDEIAKGTDILIEADVAMGQLLHARQQSGQVDNRAWMTASAFHIPFKDNSVDAAVCIRLCHHMPTAIERERLVGELLRVARRFVIMTFFDYHSPKNYLRRLRRPFNKKPPKMTMTQERVAELATEHGAKLIMAPTLSYPVSGHRYALMVKQDQSE